MSNISVVDNEEVEIINNMSKMLRNSYGSGEFFKIFQYFVKEIKNLPKYEPEDQKEMILEFIKLAHMACNDTWFCPNCLKKYKFRHCFHDLSKTIHAIEINCDQCGDYFTFTENKDTVSYFNYHVINKVSNLKSWGKGLDIKLISH
ncbi:hypothetical protein [Cohnella herbarum]|uniref:Uncharacterized protein n=1 Tax=Cohnella herbarum TaxID=2728023 RepID=A0A7Z2VNH7_9BACL|nr:hypothetical protein [Cohnella herbarum]QJD86352.1 hypothetical protein HH215_26430 [Cohnella herbarum]